MIDCGESCALTPPAPPLFDVPAQRDVPIDMAGRDLLRCSSRDASALAALDLDFIVCFTSQASDLARFARLGVWEFRFGSDEREPQPACFWESYHGDAVAHVALVRRSSDGTTAFLRRGATAIGRLSLSDSIERALGAAVLWPAVACRVFAAGNALTDAGSSMPPAVHHGRARAPAAMILSAKFAARRFMRMFDLLFTDKWNVGIARVPIDRFLQSNPWPRVEWLPESTGSDYRADPFGAEINGQTWALFERYDARFQRGRIEALEIASNSWLESCSQTMAAFSHMSYPFMVSTGGNLYCVPETRGENSVSLYRAVDSPLRWEKSARLIEGFEAVDATVFQHEGRWWLFCTDYDEPRHHRLHAFYSDKLTGPYAPHALNPVKIDPRSAGCAGTPFVINGQLYRPAQDCSRSYGASVVLNRIVELTPSTFREEVAATVAPNPNYPAGVHTLSSIGGLTLVDGKRRAFTVRRLAWRLTSALRGNRRREG